MASGLLPQPISITKSNTSVAEGYPSVSNIPEYFWTKGVAGSITGARGEPFCGWFNRSTNASLAASSPPTIAILSGRFASLAISATEMLFIRFQKSLGPPNRGAPKRRSLSIQPHQRPLLYSTVRVRVRLKRFERSSGMILKRKGHSCEPTFSALPYPGIALHLLMCTAPAAVAQGIPKLPHPAAREIYTINIDYSAAPQLKYWAEKSAKASP